MKSNSLFIGVLALLAVVGAVWYFGGGTGLRLRARSRRWRNCLSRIARSRTLRTNFGYYTEEGVTMTVTSVPAGPDVVASLRSPSGAGLGTIAVTPVVTLIGASENPIVLATTLTSNEQVQLITFVKTGITEDPKTLRGRRSAA